MSRNSRPISLHSAMVIRRAQAQMEARRQAQPSQASPPVSRRVFSFPSLFGSRDSGSVNDGEEVQRTVRAA